MLRVSKNAIIFVEPNDHTFQPLLERNITAFKNFIKNLIGKRKYHPDTTKFEQSGNYIYSISVREIEKIALGLHLPTIAYTFFNDYYEPGGEFEKLSDNSAIFQKIKKEIDKKDRKCKRSFLTNDGIIAIIFKEQPKNEEINA